MSRKSAVSLGDSIQTLMQNLGLKSRVDQYRVIDSWDEIVGEAIAKVATADRVKDHVLFVKVKGMTWRTELVFQKQEILRLISEKVGKNVVVDIRFF